MVVSRAKVDVIRRIYMQLAYLDDCGTHKESPITLCGAVVFVPDQFGHAENLHGAAIQQMFSVEEINEGMFSEFHASELHEGNKPFDSIPAEKRFQAMKVLLTAMKTGGSPYIYAAVDKKKLSESAVGSANALDMTFRVCVQGIEDWVRKKHVQEGNRLLLDFEDLFLVIMDDTNDKELKHQLLSSYRSLRVAHPYVPPHNTRIWFGHDSMYFGNSVDSVGIQMVDLCNHFMRRHLLNKPGDEDFYSLFSEQAIAARPEPDWSRFGHLFRTHDGMDRDLVLPFSNEGKEKSQAAG